MKILNSELPGISKTLEAMRKVKNKNIGLKVIRNQEILGFYINEYNNKVQLVKTPEIEAFITKEKALMVQFVNMDGTGKMKIAPDGGPDFTDKDRFLLEQTKLKAEHADVVAYLDQHRSMMETVLKEEVEIEFDLFEFDDLPELNAEELDMLGFLIKNFENLIMDGIKAITTKEA